MRFISVLFLALVIGTWTAGAQAQPEIAPAPGLEVPQPRKLTPAEAARNDVSRFVWGLEAEGGMSALTSQVFGAEEDDGAVKLWSQWNLARGRAFLDTTKIEITDLKDDEAKAHVTYTWTLDVLKSEPIEETLLLRRGMRRVPWDRNEQQIWQIVPAPLAPTESIDFVVGKPALNLFAFSLANVELASGRQSLSNLKQLGLSVMQFTQDYDEKYAFTPQTAHAKLQPYLRDEKAWQVPTTETYTFNANLADLNMAKLDDVAHTVLFYEGKNQQLAYRYLGRAAIVFADGHAALVTLEEAKTLVWKP